MSYTQLQEPITLGGLRSVHFFNGRVLTANDLSREHAAIRAADRQLGKAIGSGVAFGLDVSKSMAATAELPVVSIAAGLAVSRSGITLSLPAKTDVILSRQFTTGGSGDSRFDACKPMQAGTYLAGTGVYVLVISPASGSEGRAPVSGLENAASPCNFDTMIEGVQFRLVQLALDVPRNVQNPDYLRNLVAYVCFGVERSGDFFSGPLNQPNERPPVIEELCQGGLTPCDVPLALIHWTTSGISFIDMWSVRRTLTARGYSERWPSLTSDTRRTAAEARVWQFDEHLRDIMNSVTSPGSIVASQLLRYLPPVGLIPIATTTTPVGLNFTSFFEDKASEDVAMIDGDRLSSLVGESLFHEPISLDDSEKTQLYLVRENVEAVTSGQPVQLVLVFARHSLPYRGIARFGIAKWDLSRFVPSVI